MRIFSSSVKVIVLISFAVSRSKNVMECASSSGLEINIVLVPSGAIMLYMAFISSLKGWNSLAWGL